MRRSSTVFAACLVAGVCLMGVGLWQRSERAAYIGLVLTLAGYCAMAVREELDA